MAHGNTFTQALGLGNLARIEQPGSTNEPLSVGSSSRNARIAGLRNTVEKLLGNDIQLNATRALDLDASYQSAPHSALGLSVAVSGRATLVNADIADHLARFEDPIKALLGVAVHRDCRVIVKRRYCVGGDAQVIPERAPGRTVSVKTEEKEGWLGYINFLHGILVSSADRFLQSSSKGMAVTSRCPRISFKGSQVRSACGLSPPALFSPADRVFFSACCGRHGTQARLPKTTTRAQDGRLGLCGVYGFWHGRCQSTARIASCPRQHERI